ncbi:unnamed protein product [Phaedon cochleariae]|uniref:Uncharacterized protein n=1 Tax=Phaedon cochleariae TaxID=80249 RepID=A0A9N9SMX7_PHACE|nr:unnamed protein product [Phaedon cochleariae]
MICNKCGKDFLSRGLLVAHCCRSLLPELNVYNRDNPSDEKTDYTGHVPLISHESFNVIDEVNDANSTLNHEKTDDIPQVVGTTLIELTGIDIDCCSNLGHNDGSHPEPHSEKPGFNVDGIGCFQINEIDLPTCSKNTEFDADNFSDLDQDDSDVDPNWCPEDDGSNKMTRIIKQFRPATPMTPNNIVSQEDTEHIIHETATEDSESSESEGTVTDMVKKKRKIGVRQREEEQKRKHLGLTYKNRKGILHPAKEFNIIVQCCKKKCFENCSPEQQKMIWSNYNNKPPDLRRGTKGGKPHNRAITVTYSILLGSQKVVVCKNLFTKLHGITSNQLNLLVKKLNASEDGFIEVDSRGKHIPPNKLIDERIAIRVFIDQYPRHESHYSRRDNSNKIFLPSHLTIRQMHIEYKEERTKMGLLKSASYDVFRNVFNQTGYRFKQPYIDTCRKCDEFKALKKSATTEAGKENLNQLHNEHIMEANEAYESKRKDKESAKEDNSRRVLVFDLQQVLPAPYLSTNIVYYKRVLSVYNLTVRDYCSTESSICFMWHEVIGGRGSDQIASCIFKKIMDLPDTVQHVTTYSDTCGGQNRNVNMAAMFQYALQKKLTIEFVDQKFLLPGHTRLECDSDHARIERSKKQISDDFKIMVPRDWCQFIRSLRGKSKFSVIDMTQDDFLAFSKLLGDILVKRTCDTDGDKVSWLKIKWLRYTKEFGIIKFKYTLDETVPFKTLDLKRGRMRCRTSIDHSSIGAVPRSYSGPLGINPLKKKVIYNNNNSFIALKHKVTARVWLGT